MAQRLQPVVAVLALGMLLFMLWVGLAAPAPQALPLPGTPVAQVATATPRPALTPMPELRQVTQPGLAGTVFALLADNRLAAVRARDGTLAALIPLTPRPETAESRPSGHFLALSPDARRLYALVAGQADRPGSLHVIDAQTTEVVNSAQLAPVEARFTALAFAPAGELYLFGDWQGNLIITALDPESGAQLHSWISQEQYGKGWRVHQAAVLAGLAEQPARVYVSMLGGIRTGIEWFELGGAGLQRGCGPPSATPNFPACIAAGGGFWIKGSTLLAMSGGPIIQERDLNGSLRREEWVGLPRAAVLWDFVLDPSGTYVYTTAACDYSGGLSALNLQNGRPAALVRPGAPNQTLGEQTPCGGALALGDDPLIVVGRSARLLADPLRKGALLLLNRHTGALLHQVVLPAEPLAVIVAPQAAGSPTGRFVFESAAADGPASGVSNVFVMDASTRQQQQLTRDAGNNYDPDWSPDGRRIAFISDRETGQPGLYLMWADGSRPERLPVEAEAPNNPDWAPDGRSIAFAARGGIYRFDLLTRSTERLTAPGAPAGAPAWSPDGTQIAYVRDGNIYVMQSNGHNQRLLVQASVAPDWAPAWRREGRRSSLLAFVSQLDASSAELQVLRFETGEITTRAPITRPNTSQSDSWDLTPGWSPQGLFIALGNQELLLLHAQRERWVTLTSDGASQVQSHPDWSLR